MKKRQKMPEYLRKNLREYMKLHPLRYWLGKERKGYKLSAGGRANIIKGLKTRKISEKVVEHMKNLNKGKFGKDHPCYKEIKKQPFHKSIRELYKYRQWRSSIFQRDNFKCILCGIGGYVEADHYPVRFIEIVEKYQIKTLEQAVSCEELWDTNNGRTLCRKCHKANFRRKWTI